MDSVAYSYLRFSTPEQAQGDSWRRQTAMAERYARDHKLKLDKELSFQDLGKSAFRGLNAKSGALAAFLQAVRAGLVPDGSTLIVESLDRLSRDQILAAQAIFMQIIGAGISIVSLSDGRSYSVDSINRNPLDLLVSLVIMMRANEESATKSERVRAALQEKRERLRQRPYTARCPGWLRLNKETGVFDLVPDRVAVVQRIFRERMASVGIQTITRNLNEERIPLFGHGNQRGKMWTRAFVRHILRTPSTIGQFTACVSYNVDGRIRYRPERTIDNYFPAIIDHADWSRIQGQRKDWARHHRCDVPRSGCANVLARLSVCPFCERAMVLKRSHNLEWRYLTCSVAYEGLGCSGEWIRYSGIEEAFTRDIDVAIRGCPAPTFAPEVRSMRLKKLRTQISSARGHLNELEACRDLLRSNGRPITSEIMEIRARISRLTEERARVKARKSCWADTTLEGRLRQVRNAALAIPLDRAELNVALRLVLEKVVIDWPKAGVTLYWKHGGISRLSPDMARRREFRNRRRADRPSLGAGERMAALPEAIR